MKLQSFAIILLSLLITSCRSSDIGRKYDFIEPNSKINSDIGYLKIYTFSYEEKGVYSYDPDREVYKGYTIYTLAGDYLMDVEKAYEVPELIKLPAGEYIVVAEFQKNIINSFPIKIESGKILEIDKDMLEDLVLNIQ